MKKTTKSQTSSLFFLGFFIKEAKSQMKIVDNPTSINNNSILVSTNKKLFFLEF